MMRNCDENRHRCFSCTEGGHNCTVSAHSHTPLYSLDCNLFSLRFLSFLSLICISILSCVCRIICTPALHFIKSFSKYSLIPFEFRKIKHPTYAFLLRFSVSPNPFSLSF